MIGIQNWMNNHYGNATTCMASVSRDRIRWHEVEVTDISTRGLKFHSRKISMLVRFYTMILTYIAC